MPVENPIPEKYQVDHLILLVGNNIVPNIVAGQLLVHDSQKTPLPCISLIYSEETKGQANRIRSYLLQQANKQGRFIAIHLARQVDPSNPPSIVDAVRDALRSGDKASVRTIGLNYTGGTKAMAVHAYQAVQEWCSKHEPHISPIFSYLDAQKLEMQFNTTDYKIASYSVTGVPQIPIDELMNLHQWQWDPSDILSTPILFDATEHLVHAFCEAKDLGALQGTWRTGRGDKLLSPQINEIEKQFPTKEYKGKEGERNRRISAGLQGFTVALPNDHSLGRAIDSVCKGLGILPGATEFNLDVVLQHGFRYRQEFNAWVAGKWLESYVLGVLQAENAQQSLGLHSVQANVIARLHGQDTRFELDVVAMHGYQLFVFSCTTHSDSGHRSELKEKLIEVDKRARQLGGDEVCACLVGFAADPQPIQQEVQHDIGSDHRIRVFGRNDLRNNAFPAKVTQWIRQETRR